MIQLNLIPDLKAEYLKAQRVKRLVMSVSFIISAVFVTLVVVLFLHVNVNQRRHSDNLKGDIERLSSEYASIDDLDKIITVQLQLEELPKLHSSKPLLSRLPKYLSIITPKEVALSQLDISFEENIITVSGRGDDIRSVNVYADTIKNAIYKIGANSDEETPAFSNVTLSSITKNEEGASFELEFNFDAGLFTNRDDIVLSVPKGDYTLSERESPSIDLDAQRNNELFDDQEGQ